MRIAYTRPDGGIRIISVASRENLSRSLVERQKNADGSFTDKPLSQEGYMRHVMEKSIPADAKDVTILPDDWEAPDHDFRYAWRLRDGKVIIDQTLIKG